jgi:single-stranded-DNA-specific exonuclease
LTLELAQLLREGGPWGQAFPEPLFDGEFEVLTRRAVGDRHLKLTLRPDGGARPIEAIAFRALEAGPLPGGPRVRLAYRLSVNEFQGQCSAQLVIEQLEEIGVAESQPLESTHGIQDA